MKYTDLLSKHEIDPKKLSPALKRLVSEYKDVEAEIAKVEEKLSSGKVSDTRKKKIEEDLAGLRETLTQVDEALVKGIETWYSNRDKNIAKGQQLAAARANSKKNVTVPATTTNSTATGTSAGATQTPGENNTPASTSAPVENTPATTTTTATNTPATAAQGTKAGGQSSGSSQPAPKKKDNSGWLLVGIFTFICAVAGIAYVKSKNDAA